MIIEIRAKNCFAFDEAVTFSMKADMRNKKFGSNVHKENNFNVLKTAGIYGPNNAGKTCLIRCIKAIKGVLLNKKNGLMSLPRVIFVSSGLLFYMMAESFHMILSMTRIKKNIYMKNS